MKDLSKTYDPQSIEARIYQRWETSGYFNPDKLPHAKRRKPFSISMPPPNVTGELHLGHTLDLTTQDILIRYHRMKGDAALWVPGTDHAGIATQILVERMLHDHGISRYQIGRETFLRNVWQWKEKYGTRIVEQIRQLGASCDWSREHFTMDPSLTTAVQEAFIRLFDDGLIYRGERIIHWCVDDRTGISDLEVDYREERGTLWYIAYRLASGRRTITIATTRPETMLGDTAVAVHPKDKRYRKLVGKTALLPIVGRELPIIADERVDPEFGTGAVKVTPAHDPADFEIGKTHKLPLISVVGPDGKMTTEAGPGFMGLATTVARNRILELLQEQGLLERQESYTHNVAYCSRSNTVVEPLISKQWFVKTKPLAKLALSALEKGEIRVVPARFTKLLIHWLENIKDWNISRQLWWGHRIPVWYCIACDTPVASVKEPKERCKNCGDNAYRQDEDTLDTWFSSGLWTFSTLGWPRRSHSNGIVRGWQEKTQDLKRFHPTTVLGTGWDILFFWVARMIMLSLYLLHEIPFKTVYIHGLVLDEHGRKMSKSKGTGIDPIPMTEKYGTDALRLSLIVGTAPGLDFRMSLEKIAHQRNFCNKLWNVARYVLSQEPESAGRFKVVRKLLSRLPVRAYKLPATSYKLSLADRWILARLCLVSESVTKHLEQFQFSLAIEELQNFLWHDFADWYIEIHKVEKNTKVLQEVLRHYLILLHPFAPFITEAIWEAMGEKAYLMVEPWLKAKPVSVLQKKALREFQNFKQLIIGLRNLKIHGAENQPLIVKTSSKLSRQLLTHLTGVEFGKARGAQLMIAGIPFVVDQIIQDRFRAWQQRERASVKSYIEKKQMLAQNSKVPSEIRKQARTAVEEARQRLREL